MNLEAMIELLGGLAYLLMAGDLLVRGALGLSRRARIPPMVVGLTVVAFGWPPVDIPPPYPSEQEQGSATTVTYIDAVELEHGVAVGEETWLRWRRATHPCALDSSKA